ncbi:MAG TPA: hypothetical protein VMB34_12050 [Acetobacteraceae bacterium]|nr:hypothetical protein [Acetobacteraceae bacterium]
MPYADQLHHDVVVLAVPHVLPTFMAEGSMVRTTPAASMPMGHTTMHAPARR